MLICKFALVENSNKEIVTKYAKYIQRHQPIIIVEDEIINIIFG
jgi:hypothetical protein